MCETESQHLHGSLKEMHSFVFLFIYWGEVLRMHRERICILKLHWRSLTLSFAWSEGHSISGTENQSFPSLFIPTRWHPVVPHPQLPSVSSGCIVLISCTPWVNYFVSLWSFLTSNKGINQITPGSVLVSYLCICTMFTVSEGSARSSVFSMGIILK